MREQARMKWKDQTRGLILSFMEENDLRVTPLAIFPEIMFFDTASFT